MPFSWMSMTRNDKPFCSHRETSYSGGFVNRAPCGLPSPIPSMNCDAIWLASNPGTGEKSPSSLIPNNSTPPLVLANALTLSHTLVPMVRAQDFASKRASSLPWTRRCSSTSAISSFVHIIIPLDQLICLTCCDHMDPSSRLQSTPNPRLKSHDNVKINTLS